MTPPVVVVIGDSSISASALDRMMLVAITKPSASEVPLLNALPPDDVPLMSAVERMNAVN